MNTLANKFFNLQFSWNNKHFESINDLLNYAKNVLEIGTPYQKKVASFLLQWFDEKSFIEMFTSGTTGIPKNIQVSKKAMTNSALATAIFFNLKPKNSILHCLPVDYIAGKMMLVRCLVLGLKMDLQEPNSFPLQNIKKNYDFCGMVPLQVQNSLKNLHQIKTLIIGGSKVNQDLKTKLCKIPTNIYETFGMTETISHIAVKKINELAFTVLPNVKIFVNENQCLQIQAPNICDELLQTNDVVNLISKNQFVWLGRFDNVINSGGIKLFPEKIETKLRFSDKIRFFVYGEKDQILGEKVVLYIESEPFEIDKSAFKDLDKYEIPKKIVFVSKFTETPTGKIIRSKSRK